jgi:hypothetical protein
MRFLILAALGMRIGMRAAAAWFKSIRNKAPMGIRG